MKKDYLKKLCICSMMAALFVPLELFASEFGTIVFLNEYQIPISCFPLILTSMMFGVGWGTSTAVVGSFLSQLLISHISNYPIGVSTIIWMIPTITYAFSVAVLYKAFRKNDNRFLLTLELFISAIILSALNIGASYISNYISGGEVLAKLLAIFATLKVVGGIGFAIIFALVTPPIIKKFKKIIKV